MITVHITSKTMNKTFFRQTPASRGIWDNCRFFFNEDLERTDFWIVHGGFPKKKKLHLQCPLKNTIFIPGEPPTLKQYSDKFLRQFGTVITCHRDINHPSVIYTHMPLPWLYGISFNGDTGEKSSTIDYDSLKSAKPKRKKKLLSVISSTRVSSEGHRLRLKFIKAISNHFGENLDVFGRGFREVQDKRSALDDYQYHVVMENSSIRDYWTEKLADSYLAHGYPLYYGAPNVGDYFPEKTFTAIDIHDFDSAIHTIESVIEQNLFKHTIKEREKARNLVLDHYNFFSLLSNFCQKAYRPDAEDVLVSLKRRKRNRYYAKFLSKFK